MKTELIHAGEIAVGDWIEHPVTLIWKPVEVIHKEHGRLWFLLGPDGGDMWIVMKAYKFENLEVLGQALHAPPEGPQHFSPIFDTRDQAVKFTEGDEKHIHEVKVID